jgi:hypothetical protein
MGGEPHVEMKNFHIWFHQTGINKTVEAEVKARFFEENPRASASDYREWTEDNPDFFNSSFGFMRSRFDVTLERWENEEKLNETASMADTYRLGLGDAERLFTEKAELTAYASLNERFRDEVLDVHNFKSYYKFGANDILAFHELLADARAGTQRNAAELGVELATALTESEETLGGTTLFNELQGLRAELKAWDALLATKALPDKIALREQAKKCGERLERCFHEHGALVTEGETNPSVKYQLLATMRALGEKVAAQYAARAGKASFAGICELIRDVPNRGSKGKQRAQELNLSHDPGEALTQALGRLGRDLARIDKSTADEMKTKFLGSGHGLYDALNAWRANYTDLQKLKNLEPLRETVAKIAFALGKYKAITDTYLVQDKYRAIRDRYQETFDAFASQLQSDVQLCLRTFGS